MLFPGGSLRREISTVYRQLRKKEGQLKDLCTRQHVGAILTFIAQAHADYFRQRATKEELLQEVVPYPTVTLQGMVLDLSMGRFPHTDAVDPRWNPISTGGGTTKPDGEGGGRGGGKRKQEQDTNPGGPKGAKVGPTDVRNFRHQHPIISELLKPLLAQEKGRLQIFRLLRLADIGKGTQLPGLRGRCSRCEFTGKCLLPTACRMEKGHEVTSPMSDDEAASLAKLLKPGVERYLRGEQA